MKKELESKLRQMQRIPSRSPHDNFIVSAQVETIFMLDQLVKRLEKLNTTIEESDKQSRRLEKSNYRLQWGMLILTAIATMIIVYPFLVNIFNFVVPYISQMFSKNAISLEFMSNLSTLLAAFFAVLSGFVSYKYQEKTFTEKIKIHDSMIAVLRDKDGNIKDIRKSP